MKQYELFCIDNNWDSSKINSRLKRILKPQVKELNNLMDHLSENYAIFRRYEGCKIRLKMGELMMYDRPCERHVDSPNVVDPSTLNPSQGCAFMYNVCVNSTVSKDTDKNGALKWNISESKAHKVLCFDNDTCGCKDGEIAGYHLIVEEGDIVLFVNPD
eukprot:205094_1